MNHYRWNDLPQERLNDLLYRRFITGDKAMVGQFVLKKGCVVPLHRHHHEQIACVLEGALRFGLGEHGSEEKVVRGGEVMHLPSDLPHSVEALEDSLVLDVFSPPREDWIEGTDDYLRR